MISMVLGLVFAGALASSAQAAGCVSGGAVGALAGHYVGHGVAGAAVGCAVGHHQAVKAKRNQAAQSAERPDPRQTNRTGQ